MCTCRLGLDHRPEGGAPLSKKSFNVFFFLVIHIYSYYCTTFRGFFYGSSSIKKQITQEKCLLSQRNWRNLLEWKPNFSTIANDWTCYDWNYAFFLKNNLIKEKIIVKPINFERFYSWLGNKVLLYEEI